MTSYSPLFSKEPCIGLGTFPLASPFGDVSSEAVLAIVRGYLENGGSYIDTSPTYAFGETERLVGSVISDFPRESVFINSSCGWTRRDDDYVLSGAAVDIREDLAGSLQRLQLEYVDCYMSHMPDPSTPFSETMGALTQAKVEGLIRYIGVSNVNLEQLQEYCRHGRVDLVQNRFSIINRSLSPEFLSWCKSNAIAITAYQVIERGLLTDREDAKLVSGASDLRSRKPEFAALPRSTIRKWVGDSIRPVAERLGTSTEVLVIAWTATQPGISIVQAGASTVDQLNAIRRARSLFLDESVLDELEVAYRDLQSRAADAGFNSVRGLMGLEGVDPLKGISVSGR